MQSKVGGAAFQPHVFQGDRITSPNGGSAAFEMGPSVDRCSIVMQQHDLPPNPLPNKICQHALFQPHLRARHAVVPSLVAIPRAASAADEDADMGFESAEDECEEEALDMDMDLFDNTISSYSLDPQTQADTTRVMCAPPHRRMYQMPKRKQIRESLLQACGADSAKIDTKQIGAQVMTLETAIRHEFQAQARRNQLTPLSRSSFSKQFHLEEPYPFVNVSTLFTPLPSDVPAKVRGMHQRLYQLHQDGYRRKWLMLVTRLLRMHVLCAWSPPPPPGTSANLAVKTWAQDAFLPEMPPSWVHHRTQVFGDAAAASECKRLLEALGLDKYVMGRPPEYLEERARKSGLLLMQTLDRLWKSNDLLKNVVQATALRASKSKEKEKEPPMALLLLVACQMWLHEAEHLDRAEFVPEPVLARAFKAVQQKLEARTALVDTLRALQKSMEVFVDNPGEVWNAFVGFQWPLPRSGVVEVGREPIHAELWYLDSPGDSLRDEGEYRYGEFVRITPKGAILEQEQLWAASVDGIAATLGSDASIDWSSVRDHAFGGACSWLALARTGGCTNPGMFPSFVRDWCLAQSSMTCTPACIKSRLPCAHAVRKHVRAATVTKASLPALYRMLELAPLEVRRRWFSPTERHKLIFGPSVPETALSRKIAESVINEKPGVVFETDQAATAMGGMDILQQMLAPILKWLLDLPSGSPQARVLALFPNLADVITSSLHSLAQTRSLTSIAPVLTQAVASSEPEAKRPRGRGKKASPEEAGTVLPGTLHEHVFAVCPPDPKNIPLFKSASNSSGIFSPSDLRSISDCFRTNSLCAAQYQAFAPHRSIVWETLLTRFYFLGIDHPQTMALASSASDDSSSAIVFTIGGDKTKTISSRALHKEFEETLEWDMSVDNFSGSDSFETLYRDVAMRLLRLADIYKEKAASASTGHAASTTTTTTVAAPASSPTGPPASAAPKQGDAVRMVPSFWLPRSNPTGDVLRISIPERLFPASYQQEIKRYFLNELKHKH